MARSIICRRSNGLYITSNSEGVALAHDPATHVQIMLDRAMDRRAERWDGASGVRLATAQELADYDAAIRDGQKAQEFDNMKMLKAVAIWTAKKLGVPLSVARAEIMAEYDNL